MGYGHVNRALPEVSDSLRRAAAATAQDPNAQGVVDTLWAMITLNRVLPEACDSLYRAAAATVQKFNAQDVADMPEVSGSLC